MIAKIFYRVTLMDIYKLFIFIIQLNSVKITDFGWWNNFNHSIHCKTYEKQCPAQIIQKFLILRPIKVMCHPNKLCGGINKKKKK